MPNHNELDVSGGKPELGAPSLSINQPEAKPEDKPAEPKKEESDAAGPAEDKD